MANPSCFRAKMIPDLKKSPKVTTSTKFNDLLKICACADSVRQTLSQSDREESGACCAKGLGMRLDRAVTM